MRKTIKIDELKKILNEEILSARSETEKVLLRKVTENILHKTGNYRGFNWVYWSERGFQEWNEAGKPDFPEKDTYIYGNRSRNDVHYY